MNEAESRMAELARRFLARTADEVEQMRTCLARVDAGDPSGLEQIHQLAHRACGTGGTLGLCSLSDAAGELERRVEALPADALPGPAERGQIAAAIDMLAATITPR
jgi:HPt (histidine-containing phosphotransfer) domain-containing protein